MIAVDILEVPLSANNNRYLLVVQDYYTKWADAIPFLIKQLFASQENWSRSSPLLATQKFCIQIKVTILKAQFSHKHCKPSGSTNPEPRHTTPKEMVWWNDLIDLFFSF